MANVPFPSVTDAGNLLARGKLTTYAGAITNANEAMFVQSALLHYRWRYLEQRIVPESGWKSVALSPFDYYKAAEDRALMEKNLAMAKEFAETTPPTYGNLLMVGGTGLGKTHLSTSIARRVIERGYEVRYDSVQNVLAAYEHDRFRSGRDEADDERSRVYVDAELLILDDLGTEMVNSFSLSSLYHLLNTRINQEKPTVISTNLMEEELQTKYSDRIFSRLLGEYKILLFRGTNVRYLKK